jgi:hypothetical protein
MIQTRLTKEHTVAKILSNIVKTIPKRWQKLMEKFRNVLSKYNPHNKTSKSEFSLFNHSKGEPLSPNQVPFTTTMKKLKTN